jgi:hypothetical protein
LKHAENMNDANNSVLPVFCADDLCEWYSITVCSAAGVKHTCRRLCC